MQSHSLFVSSVLMLCAPVCYLLAAARCAWRSTPVRGRQTQAFAWVAFVFALASVAFSVVSSGTDDFARAWLSQTWVSRLMLVLIAFIGLIIVRYSHNYLQGEPARDRYYVALFLALSAVAVTVISNHLLVFLGGWVAISVCLHSLLRFYPDRPRAALAAYKKFLFARCAELALLCAFVLLHIEHGTWQISSIIQAYAGNEASLSSQVAAVLIALAALIKCAQLPVHGWLMQVVEAPTPVSALLHAGVVNMGGYLLIMFGPLLMASGWAQALILLIAGVSTVLAALSMATRISVKVKLAWSTCAQMGFMLIECALGLFELALLHLLAHSCYKAHAFLNSGSAVQAHHHTAMAPARVPGAGDWVLGVILGVALMSVAAIGLGMHGSFSVWLLMGLALSVVIAQRSSSVHAGGLVQFLVFALLVLALYVVQKLLFSHLVQPGQPVLGVWADIWLAVLFTLLYVGHVLLVQPASNATSARLRQWLFAGLYLDEWSSRITLKLLPLRLPEYKRSRLPYLAVSKKVSS